MVEPLRGVRSTDHSGTLVIFTRVEGVLSESDSILTADRGPLRCLGVWDVPVVLISAGAAADMRQLQRTCGLQEPFICENGAALHVPSRWLAPDDSIPADEGGEWERFHLCPPSTAAAVELACTMFVARGYSQLLTVGIGRDLEDYGLLTAVDIPIVVRSRHESHGELLRHVPGAYVTSAMGVAGWSEAVLGHLH